MAKTIFCTVADTQKAEAVLTPLRSAGFTGDQISVLFSEGGKMRGLVYEKGSKAAEGAATGVGTGGVIGGILGWLVGIGSLAIPGVGPFVAAGPIMAALSGGAIGGAVGGMIGALVGLGIPEIQAKNFESRLKEGDLLISVRTLIEEEEKIVKDIFKTAGAENISEGKTNST